MLARSGSLVGVYDLILIDLDIEGEMAVKQSPRKSADADVLESTVPMRGSEFTVGAGLFEREENGKTTTPPLGLAFP